ncbi:MAG: NAD(P)H-dependent oxidoreductase subunit E [Gammaproteobacteria bacterium]
MDVDTLIKPFTGKTGGVISALRAITREFGHIDTPTQRTVATQFNLSMAEVRGIISFYDDFRTSPVARRTIRICQAEACQARGCRRLTTELEETLGISLGQTKTDNSVALEPVYCLGYCDAGPNVMVGDTIHTGVSAGDLDHLVEIEDAIPPADTFPSRDDQHQIIFKRCGLADPLDLASYREHGGFNALSHSSNEILTEIKRSGLRGRGGAGFPAHIKWQTVADQGSEEKYIVCNADEGDAGTFADRMIMEGDPYLLIEGMLLAGKAVGAAKGYIYLRSEYPRAAVILNAAIARAGAEGLLREFELELFVGAGAYICGEETALIESLEGKRGIVRAKPPLPAVAGLHGQPTLVHNVITLCAVPWIVANGGEAYSRIGIGASTGTMPFQLSGNVKYGGLVEVPFGMTISQLLETFSGGTASGRPIKAVQIGGPLGAYLPPQLFDTPLTYEALAGVGAGIGHGGIIVFDDTTDLAEQARYAFTFCEHESCGKCTPCRIGSVRGGELIDEIRDQGAEPERITLLHDLCNTMRDASLCQMGGMTPIPVESALKHFPRDFGLEEI